MPSFMNEFEVDQAYLRFADKPEFPNLGRAVRILDRLVGYVNTHSDGWAYWNKPQMASDRLRGLVQGVDRFDPEDVSERDLKAALSPLKAFLTREKIDHALILDDPEPSLGDLLDAERARTAPRPFTVADALHVEPVLQAAQAGQRVRYLDEDGSTVREGTARHLVKSPDDYGFFPHDGDVRDAFLRVTLRSGMETAVPVERLMNLVRLGGFQIVGEW